MFPVVTAGPIGEPGTAPLAWADQQPCRCELHLEGTCIGLIDRNQI